MTKNEPSKSAILKPSRVSKPRVVPSEELLRGQRALVIRHAGEEYRLILTRNNRLILQK